MIRNPAHTAGRADHASAALSDADCLRSVRCPASIGLAIRAVALCLIRRKPQPVAGIELVNVDKIHFSNFLFRPAEPAAVLIFFTLKPGPCRHYVCRRYAEGTT